MNLLAKVGRSARVFAVPYGLSVGAAGRRGRGRVTGRSGRGACFVNLPLCGVPPQVMALVCRSMVRLAVCSLRTSCPVFRRPAHLSRMQSLAMTMGMFPRPLLGLAGSTSRRRRLVRHLSVA